MSVHRGVGGGLVVRMDAQPLVTSRFLRRLLRRLARAAKART